MCRFSEETINEIWSRGQVVDGFDSAKVRKDACGAWIIKDNYGNRNSPFGWEVDHIYPESKLREKSVPMSIIDNITNLRPLNWKNNDSKGSDYPSYQACITSVGERNEEGTYQYTVNENIRKQIEQLIREYL